MTNRVRLLPDEEVGYKKPPKSGQFKPGQSGNPRGRPRGSRNASTVIAEKMRETRRAVVNGKPKTVSVADMVAHRLVQDAAGGSHQAQALLLKHAERGEALEEQRAARREGSNSLAALAGPDDDLVRHEILARLKAFLDRGAHLDFATSDQSEPRIERTHLDAEEPRVRPRRPSAEICPEELERVNPPAARVRIRLRDV